MIYHTDSSVTVAAEVPFIQPSVAYIQQVKVTPSRIELYINGSLVLGFDTTFAAGGAEFGLYAGPGSMNLEYFQVQ